MASTLTNAEISRLVEELSAADESFRGRERELREAIIRLAAARPEPKLTRAFIRRLRDELTAQIESTSSSIAYPATRMKQPFPYLPIAFASSGIVIVVLAMAFASIPNAPTFRARTSATPSGQIVALAANAFGPLSGVVNNLDGRGGAMQNVAVSAESDNAAKTRSNVAPPATADAGVASAPVAPTPTAAYGMGGGGGLDAKMIAPYEPVTYRYVYKGEAISLPKSESLSVYRRKAMSVMPNVSGDMRASASLGAIDLGTFSSLKMQNVTFVEDRDNGYMITAEFLNGTISINENWDRKTDDPYRCVDGRCPTVEPLTLDQVPGDEEMIRVANAFLSQYGIDASAYGTPRIDQTWRVYMTDIALKAEIDRGVSSSFRAPDVISVVYPYRVDGQDVVSTNGDPIGMNVSVNIRTKRVASVWGISTQSYEQSAYPTVRDADRLMRIVERGGVYGYVMPNAKTVDIELGEPTIVLASFGRSVDNRWEELYVPSLSFPIVNKPKDVPVYQNAIVVPLIEELLVEPQPYPTPIPLMKEGPAVDPAVIVEPAPPADVKR